jgi:hypothetical protein
MKNFLVIFSAFCLLLTLVVIIRSNQHMYEHDYEDAQSNIDSMKIEKDSLFQLADDVLDIVFHEKEMKDSIVSNLDYQVKNSEITIEQQVRQLKELLRESNESNEFALEQKDIAIQVQRMAQLEKEKAEMARMISQKKYQELLKENMMLLEEIKNFKELTEKVVLDNIEISDTLSVDDIDIKKDKKKKNKKKKNKN